MRYALYKDGEWVNDIVGPPEHAEWYAEQHGYTYEAIDEPSPGVYVAGDEPAPIDAPTQLDRVEAQATYTALMTDTLLEGQHV